MNIPFYFRSRKQLEAAKAFAIELNNSIRKKVGWDMGGWVTLHTRYTENTPTFNNIPKNKPGKKKYLALLRANKEKIERLGVDLEQGLTELGLELESSKENKPKYDGETTEAKLNLQSYDEFRAITSVFNKAFGNGNWRINGPKKSYNCPGLQQILKRLQELNESDGNGLFFTSFLNKYADGVPVTLIVNKPNADINKYLFKVKLKA